MTLIELYHENNMYLIEAELHPTIIGAASISWGETTIPLYKSDDPDGWVVVDGYEEELEDYLIFVTNQEGVH